MPSNVRLTSISNCCSDTICKCKNNSENYLLNTENTSNSAINNAPEMMNSSFSKKVSLNLASSRIDMLHFLRDLMHVEGNDCCADCGDSYPKWTSINLGVSF